MQSERLPVVAYFFVQWHKRQMELPEDVKKIYFNKKHSDMSDDKKNIGKQDDIRVDSNDPSEVEYLHKQFPKLSHEQIKAAIKAAGPMRKDIIAYLEKGK